MIKGLFRFFGRLFRYVWSWLDALRRTLVNLVFLLAIGVVAALIWRPAPDLPDGSVLVLRPAGALVEQTRIEDPFSLLRGGNGPVAQTALRDLLEAIDGARGDERIQALILDTDGLGSAGLSKLSELRAAIERFRESGKPVLARGDRFTQAQYYLASAADEIYLSPDGFVLLRGLARYVTYFGNALENLGVKVHVFRVGEYKSFSEPFTRADMSDEDRANSRDLLNALWGVLRDGVVVGRDLSDDTFERYVMDFGGVLAEHGGDGARAALEFGLVDHLVTRDEWRAMLRARFGREVETDDDEGIDAVGLSRYLAHLRAAPEPSARVAVLVAQGSIMDGQGTPGSIGGDSLAQLIREVREDDSIQAVVLRIDSPGGSAWASELIRRELELTRKAGKPVIASMSSTAASGGYWIAAGADEIWAHPATLTGSIGIFAMFPEIAGPLDRIGVSVDGVATGPLAGAFDPRRPLEPRAAEAMQIGIEHGYRRFIQTVADARDLRPAEVEMVARGQVWTGEAASKLGLVDALGGLDDAVAAAARRAGLEEYAVVWPEGRLTPRELLLRQLSEFVSGAPADSRAARAVDSPLGGMLGGLVREAEALLQWNDPLHLYTHCLCESP